MSKLSDLLMSSGFGNPRDTDDDSDRTMQALHDAILEALFNGGVLPDDLLEQAVRRCRRGQRGTGPQSARRIDPADHRAHEGVRLHLDAAGPRTRKGAPRDGRRRRRRAGRGEVRSHRQGARFSRLPRAARSARLGRPQQRRPPRHPRPVDRHRDQRRAEAVRVRRHHEPRRHRDDPQCGEAAATRRDQGPGSIRASGPESTSTTRT